MSQNLNDYTFLNALSQKFSYTLIKNAWMLIMSKTKGATLSIAFVIRMQLVQVQKKNSKKLSTEI